MTCEASNLFLSQIQLKTLILRVALKPQYEFDVLDPACQARMDGINQRGKIKGRLRFFRPAPRGPEKRIAAHFSHQQFF